MNKYIQHYHFISFLLKQTFPMEIHVKSWLVNSLWMHSKSNVKQNFYKSKNCNDENVTLTDTTLLNLTSLEWNDPMRPFVYCETKNWQLICINIQCTTKRLYCYFWSLEIYQLHCFVIVLIIDKESEMIRLKTTEFVNITIRNTNQHSQLQMHWTQANADFTLTHFSKMNFSANW